MVKGLLDTAPAPEIVPVSDMLELQPALNNVAQSVVNFTLKTKLASNVLGFASGMFPIFHIIELELLSNTGALVGKNELSMMVVTILSIVYRVENGIGMVIIEFLVDSDPLFLISI